MFEYTKTPVDGKCIVKRCGSPAIKKKGCLCHKHYQQKWRHNNPEQAAYRALKDHALHRKLKFEISFDYFCGLADGFAYFDKSCEQRGEVASIDRVDASLGYVRGNLQVISISENVIKGNKERYLPEYVQALLERQRLQQLESQPVENDENPF